MDDVFEYTHNFHAMSDLTPEVHYNANTRDLMVNLDPADDAETDVLYVYHNVPQAVFDEFRNADSKGAFYNRVIKRTYGPGDLLGDYLDIEEIEVSVNEPEPVLTSVPSTTSMGGDGTFRWNVPIHAVGTPKALVEKEPVNEPAVNEPSNYVSLATPAVSNNLRKFVVAFEVGNKITDYTLYETDWNAAAVAVEALGDQLGQNFKVKGLSLVD